MEAVERYIDAARQNKTIFYEGLEFRPLKVKDYALYRNARPAMELMLSSLPVAFARLSWCSCLDALDQEATRESGKTAGMLLSILLVLNEALNLHAERDPSRMQLVRGDDGKLKSIVVMTEQHKIVAFSMAAMSTVRVILAAQNNFNLPDENWNPELVRAKQYIQAQQTTDLKFDLETLVYSVALNSGKEPETVWEWPIRKFELMQAAIDRKLCYQLYTAAELSQQVKFKRGNPVPSWKFDRVPELPTGFKTIAELDAGAKGLLSEKTS